MISLNELKIKVEAHMKNELEIFKMVFDLDKQDAEQFTVWYNNHTYCKCIDEIKEIVDRRCGEAHEGSQTQSDFRNRSDS
jgi:hypothetical protein